MKISSFMWTAHTLGHFWSESPTACQCTALKVYFCVEILYSKFCLFVVLYCNLIRSIFFVVVTGLRIKYIQDHVRFLLIFSLKKKLLHVYKMPGKTNRNKCIVYKCILKYDVKSKTTQEMCPDMQCDSTAGYELATSLTPPLSDLFWHSCRTLALVLLAENS